MNLMTEKLIEASSRGVMKYSAQDHAREMMAQEKSLSPEKKKVLAFFKKYRASGTGHGKDMFHFEFLPYSEGKLDLGIKEFDSFIQLRFKGDAAKNEAIKFYKKYWKEGEMWELWEMGGAASNKNMGQSHGGRQYVIYDKNGDGKGLEA